MDPANFFDVTRRSLGRFTQSQINGFNAVLKATELLPKSHRAYVLATAWHETAHTMQPIDEFGKGRGKAYGKPGRNNGQVPYGRGFVQLTWDDNYERMDRELGLNGALIRNYELAKDPKVAADILVVGMVKGLFNGRGKGLEFYLPCAEGTLAQFKEARRTVNVQDKAAYIADLANIFQRALT